MNLNTSRKRLTGRMTLAGIGVGITVVLVVGTTRTRAGNTGILPQNMPPPAPWQIRREHTQGIRPGMSRPGTLCCPCPCSPTKRLRLRPIRRRPRLCPPCKPPKKPRRQQA